MIKANKKISYLLAAIFTAVLFVLTAFAGGGAATVYAAESANVVYSNVLDDLKKDNGFSAANYPEKADDYSLQVIQIAESTDKELFVYVHQPSGQTKKLIASSINISTTINDEINYFNYKLQLLNSSGVFFKYKVQDFTVKDEPTRYYAISSIYRPFDETIDKQAEHDNTITEVNYDVSKQYCFSMINGKPYVNVVDIETIIITDKFVGFVRYFDGFKFYPSADACDSHFVAFNTDRPIDKLLEADVYYTKQSYSLSFNVYEGENEKFGKAEDCYAYVTEKKVTYNGGGLWAGTYKWERIETVERFIAETDLTKTYSGAILDVTSGSQITDEGKAALQGKKWVLRFVETDYSAKLGTDSSNYSTLIGDVSILRLKFEYDGITYNLGTIDNKQTGGNKPINGWTSEIIVNNRGKRILAIIAVILLLLVLPPVFTYIIRPIVWLISLPFKAIGALFKKQGK